MLEKKHSGQMRSKCKNGAEYLYIQYTYSQIIEYPDKGPQLLMIVIITVAKKPTF